jgi:tripeptide aminopeptidase
MLTNHVNLMDKVNSYIDSHMPEYIQLLYDVVSIASPTGKESNKAQFILKALHDMGAGEAYLDDVGNVVYPYHIKEKEKFPLYTAHMDTVFEGVDTITPEIDGQIMKAPSIGDNSSNIAALLFLIRLFRFLKIDFPALFCFNVGEEGLGNLKGSLFLTDSWQNRLSAFIAIDGQSDRFVNAAVGSHRYAVHVVTKGGHSFANFGRRNAIAAASEIITDFYQLKVPKAPKTTYNIGTIQGGSTINTIASDVEFTVDMRSVSSAELERLDEHFQRILENHRSDEVIVETLLLGKRPCGEAPVDAEIYRRISKIRERDHKLTHFDCGSTDANIALSRGIPAMAFGVGRTSGAHTLEEELDLASISPGLKQMAAFILDL